MAPTRIHVRFATNRNQIAGGALFGKDFANNEPKQYVTGSIDVVRLSNLPDTGWTPLIDTLVIDPPTPRLETVLADAHPTETPATGLVAFADERRQAQAMAAAPGYGLILLPGFASTFIDALRRAAQIAFAYRAADIFCFSWPANGRVNLADYRLDRLDAESSGQAIADALAQFLAKIRSMPAGQRPTIHVVCHSMGAFAFRAAVQVIRRAQADLIKTRAFEGALLMAADEDDDALSDENRLGPLLKLARRVAAYAAGGDLALGIAQVVNGRPRLGHWGPRNLTSFPKSVTRIDCSDVAATQGDHGETHFSHQYYRLAPRVIADVVQVFAGKQPSEITGRLADPANPAGGRAFILPFDAGAAHLTIAAAPLPTTSEAVESLSATGPKRAASVARLLAREARTSSRKRSEG